MREYKRTKSSTVIRNGFNDYVGLSKRSTDTMGRHRGIYTTYKPDKEDGIRYLNDVDRYVDFDKVNESVSVETKEEVIQEIRDDAPTKTTVNEVQVGSVAPQPLRSMGASIVMREDASKKGKTTNTGEDKLDDIEPRRTKATVQLHAYKEYKNRRRYMSRLERKLASRDIF